MKSAKDTIEGVKLFVIGKELLSAKGQPMPYEKLEARLSKTSVAFVPFTILGYPSLELSKKAVRSLASIGATIYETAIPVSHGWSSSTGPILRQVNKAAVRSGVTLDDVIDFYRNFRPNLCLIYRPLLLRNRVENLLSKIRGKIDSVLFEWDSITPEKCSALSREFGVDIVQCVSPRMKYSELKTRVLNTEGMVYMTCAAATGGRLFPLAELRRAIREIKSMRQIPVCCGLGIRTVAQAKAISRIESCDGIIVGTSLIEKLGRSFSDFCRFATEIKKITLGANPSRLQEDR
jgi:tryptophan synthase alpha chain